MTPSPTRNWASVVSVRPPKPRIDIQFSKLNVCTYNARTLLEDFRLDSLLTQLENIKWDIVGISEVKRRVSMLLKLNHGHILYHSERLGNNSAGVLAVVDDDVDQANSQLIKTMIDAAKKANPTCNKSQNKFSATTLSLMNRRNDLIIRNSEDLLEKRDLNKTIHKRQRTETRAYNQRILKTDSVRQHPGFYHVTCIATVCLRAKELGRYGFDRAVSVNALVIVNFSNACLIYRMILTSMESIMEYKQNMGRITIEMSCSFSESSLNDENSLDLGSQGTGAPPSHIYASSLPVSMPGFQQCRSRHSSEEDDQENRVQIPVDARTMAASIKALAISVKCSDGTEMFGELPGHKMKTSDIALSRMSTLNKRQ
ncbi:hypothetical protein GQR58_019697 [Nymphon striatum]|nr:hypothetical protein GQR58_019697 [Nymphon striatum]